MLLASTSGHFLQHDFLLGLYATSSLHVNGGQVVLRQLTFKDMTSQEQMAQVSKPLGGKYGCQE